MEFCLAEIGEYINVKTVTISANAIFILWPQSSHEFRTSYNKCSFYFLVYCLCIENGSSIGFCHCEFETSYILYWMFRLSSGIDKHKIIELNSIHSVHERPQNQMQIEMKIENKKQSETLQIQHVHSIHSGAM